MTEDRTCPNGHAILEGDAYCTVCGARVAGAAAPSVPHGGARAGRVRWIVLACVVLVAVAGVVTWVALSSDEDTVRPVPTTAQFCDGYNKFGATVSLIPPDSDEYAERLKRAASDLEDVGTPNDMPADAEDGLRIMLDAIQELDDDATQKDAAALRNELALEDSNQVLAFDSYGKEACLGVVDGDG